MTKKDLIRTCLDRESLQEDLDDWVNDEKSKEASKINNQGAPGQIEYLMGQGYTIKAIAISLGLEVRDK